MLALLQQQDYIDKQLMNDAVPHVPHTEFEGYKAITNNVVHSFPKDMNGLKSAVTPQQFVTPLRNTRTRNQMVQPSSHANIVKLPPISQTLGKKQGSVFNNAANLALSGNNGNFNFKSLTP